MIEGMSDQDIKRLSECIKSGITVKSDIDDLREGLKETIDAVSEQLDIPKKVLNKAVAIAYKESKVGGEFDKQNEELNAVETLLQAAGMR